MRKGSAAGEGGREGRRDGLGSEEGRGVNVLFGLVVVRDNVSNDIWSSFQR